MADGTAERACYFTEHHAMTKQSHSSNPLPELPGKPIQRYLDPLTRFMHVESSGGIVLLVCTIVSLALANSPLGEGFIKFWKTPVGFSLGGYEVIHPLYHWINDGLMAIFFFVIGLEVKREMVLGELRDLRRAALPIAAALGGMIVPAGVYLAMQWAQPAARGWGIPMATDIAFVVGCMALLGPKVPHSLRVMLLSLAIVDDIGAILVIAIGYTDSINFLALALGAGGVVLVVVLSRLGVRSVGVYTILGALVWFAVHESGIHATIAGVILGLLTPAHRWVSPGLFGSILDKAGRVFDGEDLSKTSEYTVLRHMETASREAISPLERLETSLHPWVGFVIMPLFALANACVPIDVSYGHLARGPGDCRRALDRQAVGDRGFQLRRRPARLGQDSRRCDVGNGHRRGIPRRDRFHHGHVHRRAGHEGRPGRVARPGQDRHPLRFGPRGRDRHGLPGRPDQVGPGERRRVVSPAGEMR